MKHKVIKDKKSGETRIDYYKEKERNTFRYDVLKKLLCNKELIIRIDTNLVEGDTSDIDISKSFETYFESQSIPYQVLPTNNNKQKKIFGINVKVNLENAYIILFYMKEQDLSVDFFNKYLQNCDLDIGISPKISFEEILKETQKGYISGFFGTDYFEGVIYDSNYVGTMRISSGIKVDLF